MENIIKNIKVSKLQPYERNPRRNDKAVDEVVKSIQNLGYKTPIIIDENFVILCGHTRFKAIKKLGWTEIPFVVQYDDLNDQQKNEYRVRDNKSAELAEWDFEILEEDFSVEDLQDMGFDNINSNFEPGTIEEQGKLDELKPKYVICPECGKEFDCNEK